MNVKTIFFIIISILLAFFTFSCQKKSTKWQDTTTTGVVPITCDQCFQPIIQEEINVFEAIYPVAGIVPIYTDEVESIDLLLKDSVRFAVVTRTLTDAEKALFASKKIVVRELKIAEDAIALIVNKSNPDSIISMDTFKKILFGEITEWKQINPKSTLGKIDVMFDNKNSSTVRFVIDSVCGGKELSENLYAQKTNQEVVEMVSRMPNAMGVVGVNWVSNDKDSTNLSFTENITTMAVSAFSEPDEYNSYKPYQAYIALKHYPMIRSVYILLSDPRSGLSTGFASFVASDRGQRIILKSGLLPATQPVNLVHMKDE